MPKRFFMFLAAVLPACAGIYLVHNQKLETDPSLNFNLLSAYSFYFVALIVICLGVEIILKKNSDQVGFSFLIGVSLKLVLFALIFGDQILGDTPLPFTYRLHLLLPMFLFTLLEAFYAVRVMNKL